jgi:hypothetical protein
VFSVESDLSGFESLAVDPPQALSNAKVLIKAQADRFTSSP